MGRTLPPTPTLLLTDKEARIGVFELPTATLRLHPERLHKVFDKVVVVSAVKMFGKEYHQYIAYSRHFDWVPIEAKAPFYKIVKNGQDIAFERL